MFRKKTLHTNKKLTPVERGFNLSILYKNHLLISWIQKGYTIMNWVIVTILS